MLLVQSCSKSKIQAEEPVPALELYSGYFYNIIKKATREEDLRSDLDLCILSAKHGLIDPDTDISTYDQRMNEERASELASTVPNELASRIAASNHDHVVVNLGQVYQEAVAGFESQVDADVQYLSGKLGERGSTLKALIRTSTVADLPIDAA